MAFTEMYPRIPWELVAVPLGSAEHASRTTDIELQSLYTDRSEKYFEDFFRGKGNPHFIYASRNVVYKIKQRSESFRNVTLGILFLT